MVGTVVGFFIRHFNQRGTEIAVYDYADYNETILKNKSIIFHFSKEKYLSLKSPYIDECFTRFKNRFQMVEIQDFDDLKQYLINLNVKIFYTLTYGFSENYPYSEHINVLGIKYLVHCVFNTTRKFGDIYVPISDYLNKKFGTNYPVLPHMIRIHDTNDDLREELGIPKDAVVFGRYGGYTTFDIDYVKETVFKIALENKDKYFIFMNTEKFCENLPNVIFLPVEYDLYKKRKFINTCDAYLHGRNEGETFGLAIGEFACCYKPIITTISVHDNAHLDILGNYAIVYTNQYELTYILQKFFKGCKDMTSNGYLKYSPENVMTIFSSLIGE
jgi:hypothetical protein